MVEEIQENEEEDDASDTQVWDDFEETSERFRKSLYYGRYPSSDRLSLPVTKLCVSRFNDLGLEDIESKLDRLDVEKAAEITRDTCASPTSLVLALMYLDRLRNSNPKYLNCISSTDLFLVSLMVASKYLYDDGEEDEVFNDEWANSGNMEKKELNRLELEFLSAIDWNIYVSPEDYETTTQKLEFAIAVQEVETRSWKNGVTYNELDVLSRNSMTAYDLWRIFYDYSIKVTAVCAFAYAASLMTMIGTCHLLSKTSIFSPASMQNSIGYFFPPAGKNPGKNPDATGNRPEMESENDTLIIDQEDHIQNLNEKLRLTDLDLYQDENLTESCVINGHNQFVHHIQDDLLREHVMISRLTRALFALKIGSFRDLMLGPQFASNLGHV